MNSEKNLPDRTDHNFIEKIGLKLPGISGYLKKETARDSDQRLRAALSDRLTELKEEIHNFQSRWVDAGHLEGLDLLERLNRKIDEARDTIRYAARGYSGMFDGVKIREADIKQLNEYDVALAGQIGKLFALIKMKFTDSMTNDIRPWAQDMELQLDDFLKVLHARRRMLEVEKR